MNKLIKLTPLILAHCSSLSAATFATYLDTSGRALSILTNSGSRHSYSGANLEPNADLSYAGLSYADLTGADLAGADLTGADLTGGDLTEIDFSYADLTDANLIGAALWRNNFSNALLIGADLKGTDLRESDFTNADFTNADLRSALLGSHDLNYAFLTDAVNVNEATWTNANLWGATLPGGYDQAWFESQGATFVPEPSSYALICGGLAIGFVAFRRR